MDTLIGYGLAKWDPKNRRALLPVGPACVYGCGSIRSSELAYVVHRFDDDGEPGTIGRGRTFPLKKTVREFGRAWKRITAAGASDAQEVLR